MNEINFYFEGQSILAIERDGEPWFVARDVCKALGISYSGATLKPIHEDWKGMIKLNTPRNGGAQGVRIISEPALYKLAFRSNSPGAETFTNWVASEVIPSIRKAGRYEIPGSLALLEEHTKRPVQLQNSKRVNASNMRRGGLAKAVDYNRENCCLHTGFRPSELKEIASGYGLKSVERTSGKEVARHLDPAAACSMSLADSLVERGHSLEQVAPITLGAMPVFKGLLELGERPRELEDVG